MGIRGLGALLREKGEQVNLAEMAQRTLAETGKPLRLAVDGWALVFWLLRRGQSHGVDSRYGGQHWAIAKAASDFVARMKLAGLELLVLWDGPAAPDKRDETTRRMREGITAASQAWRELWAKGEFDPRIEGIRAPLLTRNTVSSALAEAGVENRFCHVEADSVIAGLCLRHECRAVLSNDSDYFVLGCDYIPLDRLVFRPEPATDVEARLYTFESVAASLHVNPKLLPLVANLAGNDYTFTSVLAVASTSPAPAATATTTTATTTETTATAATATAAAATTPPPAAVVKTAALIAAIEFVQKHEAELMAVVDDIPALAEMACKSDEALKSNVVQGLRRYAMTEPIPLPEALQPLLGGALLNAALHGYHSSSTVPEDLGSKHPKFTALHPIAEVIRPVLSALYAIAMGPGKLVDEAWQRHGELIEETITTGPWPFPDQPEATLAEIRALPAERRRALLLTIFDVNHSLIAAVTAATAPSVITEPFALLTLCMCSYLIRQDEDNGLPLSGEDIAALLAYLYERKENRQWIDPATSKPAKELPQEERPFVARGVHLFNLFQQMWSMIEQAHIVLNCPFGTMPPPPQRVFDGATWLAVYRRVRTKGLTGAETNWATKIVPAAAAHTQIAMRTIKREIDRRKKREQAARETSKGATIAAAAAAASKKRSANAFELLEDDQ